MGSGQTEGIAFDVITPSGVGIVLAAAAVLACAVITKNLWLLEILHVGGGATWMVLDVFLGFVLAPILNSQPFATRLSIASKLLPKMLLLMPVAVTLTLAAGWTLAYQIGNTLPTAPAYRYVTASYFVAAFLEITALGFLQPANVAVMMEIKQASPSEEVVSRLMRRFALAARALGAGQLVIVVLMTRIARLS